MAKHSAKLGVALIAAVIIGAGVFAFVAYTTFDAIGFGRVYTYGDEFAPTWGTNQTIQLSAVPEDQPIVTYWNLTGGLVPEVNGTVVVTNITWTEGLSKIYIYSWNWTHDPNWLGTPYSKDTAYLKFNYTGQGSAPRAITMPVIVLVAVFAIVIVASVLVRGSGSLGGKKGGRKSFP